MATIVVFAAHNDDHALAMGGTIAQHVKQGDVVETFIGSFGELSHPHLKPEVIRKTRVKEAQKADKAYGNTGTVIFLGLRELKFAEDFERKGYHRKLLKRLRQLDPARIYIPAPNDTHPDHKAIGQAVLKMLEKTRLKAEVYAYHVYPQWHRTAAPVLVVNVTPSYRKKLEALSAFRSQIKFFSYALTNNLVYIYHLVRNWLAGFRCNAQFAETFWKVR